MKTFKINSTSEIQCDRAKTRYGFRHDAKLFINGRFSTKSKVCYYNRTWESFEYETVISQLLDKAEIFTSEEKKAFMDSARKDELNEVNKNFAFLGTLAKMGEILSDNQAEANDFKARILKAGLSSEGLTMPDDWNELSEDEKIKRLNNVINHLSNPIS